MNLRNTTGVLAKTPKGGYLIIQEAFPLRFNSQEEAHAYYQKCQEKPIDHEVLKSMHIHPWLKEYEPKSYIENPKYLTAPFELRLASHHKTKEIIALIIDRSEAVDLTLGSTTCHP